MSRRSYIFDGCEQKTAINYVHLQLYSKKENNCYEENN